MNKEERGKAMGRLIARALSDEPFKRRLLDDGASVLREQGFDVPEGLEVRVLQNTDTTLYLTIPPKPRARALSDQEMEQFAGGGCGWWDTFLHRLCGNEYD